MFPGARGLQDAVQYGGEKTSVGMAPDLQGRNASSGWVKQQRTDQRALLFPQLTDVCLSECLLNRRGSLDPMQQNRPQVVLGDVISRRFVLFVSVCVLVSECAHESPSAHRGQTASEPLEQEPWMLQPPGCWIQMQAFARVVHAFSECVISPPLMVASEQCSARSSA